jgi:hypothetical protein
MLDEWATNSHVLCYDCIKNPLKQTVIAAFIAIFSLIFLHSLFVNGFKFTQIRTVTDISCVCAIAGTSLLYSGMSSDDPLDQKIFINLFFYSIFVVTVQLCDIYVVRSLCVKIDRLQTCAKMLINFYIWFLLVLSHAPYGSFFPLVWNMNNEQATILYKYLNKLQPTIRSCQAVVIIVNI